MAQRDRAEYFYNQRKAHIVLGLTSLALIGLMGLIAYDDWNREWRQYQREFREIDLQRTREELRKAQEDNAVLVAEAKAALELAREPLAVKEQRLASARARVEELRAEEDSLVQEFLEEFEGEGEADSLAVAATRIAQGENAETVFEESSGEIYESDDDFYDAFDIFEEILADYQDTIKDLRRAEREFAGLERQVSLAREDARRGGELRAKLTRLEAEALRARMEYQAQKAILDQTKFEYENHKNHHHGPADDKYMAQLRERLARYEADQAKTQKLQNASLALELEVANAQAELDKLAAPLKEAERLLKRAQFDQDRFARKISSIEPNLINDAFRNLPLLDFINPSERINQVIVDGIREDLHFTDVRKIDRCHSCHVTIAKPGYEDAPQPLTTHPNLELYVSDNSPHPLGQVGCTVCHEGNGLATSFDRAAHAPNSHEQQEEWEKKYHWHRLHHWDFPMHKKGNYEASCMKCHETPEETPEAATLLQGHSLFLDKGCYACHSIDKKPYQGLRKPGPQLKHLAAKLTPEWTARWLANPWAFRPDTKMPRLFGLENMDSPEEREQDAVMVEAITRYLFANSGDLDLATPPAQAGDPARGRELVKTVGCMACHSIDDIASEHADDPEYYQSGFGPNLSKVGTKVNRAWLNDWLLNPQHYWADSNMPSLRLETAEANDMAAYLLTLRDDSFLAEPRPEAREEVLDHLLVLSLAGKMPESDAKSRLTGMSLDEKYLELGKKGIQFKNCFACHDIAGFEEANPVVVNFTYEGSKDKDQLNFGYIPHEHLLEEQIETAHHKGEPLLSYAHYEHKPEDRMLRPRPKPEEATGSATLRWPETHGNAYVPYPTDPDNSIKAVEDVFLPKERFDWIFNQVKNPQLWDRGINSTYFNKMKMPQFGLTDAEAHALAVFVSAQTRDIIREEHKDTGGDRVKAIAEGRAVLKRYNCYACHTVGVYRDKVSFELTQDADRYSDEPVANFDLGRHRVWAAEQVAGKVEVWEYDEESGADKPTGRFKSEPFAAFQENQWLVGDAWDPTAWDDFTGTMGLSVPVPLMAGSHYVDEVPVWGLHEGWMRQYYSDVALSPPMLYREGEKVQPDWLFEWLTNVHTIRPNLSVRMPQYDFSVEEATALVRFFSVVDEQPWPYEEGKALPTDAETLAKGEEVFYQLLQCNSCHPSGENLPTGNDLKQWGPNLALAQKRLKPRWITETWLPNPQGFYPGTYMPNNFYSFEGGHLKPLLGSDEQMRRYIESVSAWLFSLDERQAVMDYGAIRRQLDAADSGGQ